MHLTWTSRPVFFTQRWTTCEKVQGGSHVGYHGWSGSEVTRTTDGGEILRSTVYEIVSSPYTRNIMAENRYFVTQLKVISFVKCDLARVPLFFFCHVSIACQKSPSHFAGELWRQHLFARQIGHRKNLGLSQSHGTHLSGRISGWFAAGLSYVQVMLIFKLLEWFQPQPPINKVSRYLNIGTNHLCKQYEDWGLSNPYFHLISTCNHSTKLGAPRGLMSL